MSPYQKYQIFREYPSVGRAPFSHPALSRALDVAKATATSWFGQQLFAQVFPDSVSNEAALTRLRQSLLSSNFATVVVCHINNDSLGGHHHLLHNNEIMISSKIVNDLIAAYNTNDAVLLNRYIFETSVIAFHELLHWYRTRWAPGTQTPPSYKPFGLTSKSGGGEFGWWGEHIVYNGLPTGFRSLNPPFLLDLVALARPPGLYHPIPDHEIHAFLANPRAAKVWLPTTGPPVLSFPNTEH